MRKIELQAGQPPARITPHAMSPTPQMSARETADRRVADLWCATVHGRVNDVLPILAPGIAYGRHDLCGQAFIARLQPRRRQQVDACLADLVMRGAQPLELVFDDVACPPRYRLKEGAGDGVSPSAAIAQLDTNPNFER